MDLEIHTGLTAFSKTEKRSRASAMPTDPTNTARPYQRANADAILAHLQRRERVIYALPTGGGKTFVASDIIRTVTRLAGWRVGFFVHRRELLEQASRSFGAWQIDHGLVSPGHVMRDDVLVHVASVDTVGRRIDKIRPWLQTLDLVVVDEAHHAVAAKWRRVLINVQRKCAVLGITATPWRLDGRPLSEEFQHIVCGPSIGELTDDGYLAPAIAYHAPTQINLQGVAKRGGDYVQHELQRSMLTNDNVSAAVANYARFLPGVPSIAFCAGIEHTEQLAAALRHAGWMASEVHGRMPVAQRDSILRALGSSEMHVVTSCDLISEGTDLPIVGGAILVRPTESSALHLQQIGRALRVHPHKDEAAIILDLVGNLRKHGLPNQPRRWSLERGYMGLDGDPPRRCPQCWHVHAPALACPQCGRQYLSPISDEHMVNGKTPSQIKALTMTQAIRLARNFEDMKTIGRIRGYKPGWAWHQWRQRKSKEDDFWIRSRINV